MGTDLHASERQPSSSEPKFTPASNGEGDCELPVEHPYAAAFPLMDGIAFDELVADIEANGCASPSL